MQEEIVLSTQAVPARPFSLTLRELLATMFRHRRLAVHSFLGILAGALLVAPRLPKYQADMKTLAEFYLSKHLDVHRSPGQYHFFQQQAERYRADMEAVEAKLTSSNSVAPQLVRDMTLQKLADFKATLEQTRMAIHETQQRIANLQQQKATVPSRLTTQVRRSDNPALLEQLKSALLNLELKRAELLSKYQPSYQPVRQVEQQIA